MLWHAITCLGLIGASVSQRKRARSYVESLGKDQSRAAFLSDKFIKFASEACDTLQPPPASACKHWGLRRSCKGCTLKILKVMINRACIGASALHARLCRCSLHGNEVCTLLHGWVTPEAARPAGVRGRAPDVSLRPFATLKEILLSRPCASTMCSRTSFNAKLPGTSPPGMATALFGRLSR